MTKIKLTKKGEKQLKSQNCPYVRYTSTPSGANIKIIKIDDLAYDILQHFPIKTIYGSKSEEVWCYDDTDGLWKRNGREIIKTQVEEMLGEHARNSAVNEVYEKIKRLTAISREEFDKCPVHLLCIKNGILDVVKKELLPFSPDYYFKTRLDISFIPSSDCPQIKKFIGDTFYENDAKSIQQWFGYHLYKKHFIKKVLLVFGERDTGKSVFLNLLVAFVGEKNKAGVSLQAISKGERFVLAFLKDKMANVYDDLKQQDISDTGGLKVATGGSYVTGEYKFGDVFEFQIYAKNTFSANKIPAIKEIDMAYYDRFMPVCCDNVIPKDEQDKFLIEKLTSPEELSGLLNWALEGLGELLKNGNFSYNKTAEEIKKIMESRSNGLSAFCDQCLIKTENGKISKEVMYDLYKQFSSDNNLQILNKTVIGRNLYRFAPYVIAGREKERYWSNVGLSEKCPGKVKEIYEKLQENEKNRENLTNKDTTLTTLFEKAIGQKSNRDNIDMVSGKASYPSYGEEHDTYDASDRKGLISKEEAEALLGGQE